jgi:hypothetical protein
MLALISSALQALVLYLRLRVVSARYDLERRIEADIEADEKTLTALRDRGDDAAARAADLVRQRIERARGVVGRLPADLPAADPAAPRWAAGADTGGDLPPAGG